MADWQYAHMQYYKTCTRQAFLCRIREIIGESNIWRVTLKMQLARFLIGGFEYCMERNPCLQPNWHTLNLAIFT